MERVNLQELPKDERKLCRRWSEIKFSFVRIPNIKALLHLSKQKMHNWDIFVKPSLSIFPTGQDNFVPIQLQPEICSASSADPPRTFPALYPQMSIACKWIPHANEQLSEYDKTVLLFQFCDSRKTRQLHYLCYLLSKTSVKHIVGRFRITYTSSIVS